jgi:L-arabinose isomerase
MTAEPTKLKVGLLALTLEFYERGGPDIREGRQAWLRRSVLAALAGHAEVLFDGAVFRRDDIERTVASHEAAGADVLLVILLTYSTSLSSLPALAATRLPIVVWNTQELHAVDESYDTAAMTANHGVHGTFDLCNVLVRSQVPFGYVTSHLDDAGCVDDVVGQLRAAAAVSYIRRMRVGLMGYPFPGMGDFGLDTTHLVATLGTAWEALSIADFNARAAAADAERVTALVGEYRQIYAVDDGIDDDALGAAARAELAMRGMIDEYRLDACSYQFLAFGQDDRTETVPFVAASRLMAEGIGFGGEGDLISAVFATALNRIQPPAGFTEIFTVDFAGNGLLLSHMGEANVAMARRDRKIRLARRERPLVPVRSAQLALATTYEPGPATLAALTLADDHTWRIIASPVTIEDFGPLDALAAPHAKVATSGDVRDFLTAYATAGGPHHMAICFGDALAQLALLAALLGADYVEV